MSILDLPNELLLLIAVDLPVKELYRFLSTCHRLSSLLTPHFHKLALQDVGSFTALQWAARYGHAPLAELVLSKGAGGGVGSEKRREPHPTPLHLAASHNHPDVIRVLAKHGERITARTFGDNAPLHEAAIQRSAQAIKVLLELGADIASEDKWGRTPAHISAAKGDVDSMRAFIDAGLDFFHSWGERGWTILHDAVLNQKGEMVKFLLGHGGEKLINAQDTFGMTPLHRALFGMLADKEIVQLLCDHGADTEMADYDGQTPLDLARVMARFAD